MSYSIFRTDGTLLTTIADGTVNTTSTSLSLMGRNYSGYGQVVDTNFLQQLENFSDTTPPVNPLSGQLWWNTTNSTLYVCPIDGAANASVWYALLTSNGTTGNVSFGNVAENNNVCFFCSVYLKISSI